VAAQGEDIAALSFEDALARLEAIVRRLESGDASLEDSIGLYEEGSRLKAQCEQKLSAASARIEKIQLGPDGQATGTVPFDAA
jgi:exodeoxyribonuclease VII small subunit